MFWEPTFFGHTIVLDNNLNEDLLLNINFCLNLSFYIKICFQLKYFWYYPNIKKSFIARTLDKSWVHCEKELSNGRLDTPVMGVSYTLVKLNYLWLYKEVSNSI